MLIELPDTTFGRNIFYLRKKYKLSRTAIAKLTGISTYTLKDWEEGKRKPILTYDQINRISVIFDLPSEDLIYKDFNE